MLIVIGALAFFGLLNPSRFLPERCDIGTGLQCVGFSAYGLAADHGGITFYVYNGVGGMMRNVEMEFETCDDVSVASWDSTRVIPLDWNPGSGYQYHLGDPESGTGYNHPEGVTKGYRLINCDGITPNARFRSEIILRYEVAIEGQTLSQTRRGVVSVNAQECTSDPHNC